jgi:acetyl-CoA carboxylase biotin carboxyl carrier protein
MQVDRSLVRDLAELLKETDLSEIEVVDGERRVRVARQIVVNTAVAAAPVQIAPAQQAQGAPAQAIPAAGQPQETAKHPGTLPSPMVGTVYLAAEPGKPPFVSVGSAVKEGQTLLIIEAMKVMNPILAPRAGTITKILVSNEQPVEYGESLLIIE